MDNKVKCNCPICGGIYYANPARLKFGRQTTCGRVCSYKLRAAKSNRSEEHKCSACGKPVFKSPSKLKSRYGEIFCSKSCAYSKRKRTVSRPYKRISVVDYSSASKKAWDTRRKNPKPYPEASRVKAATRAIERIKNGGSVSKFEREAAKMFARLGFNCVTSYAVRNSSGRYAAVFDIYVPSRRIFIECHGNFWHGGRWTWRQACHVQIKNLVYEERKIAIAKSMDIEVRILWESEFKKDPACSILSVMR